MGVRSVNSEERVRQNPLPVARSLLVNSWAQLTVHDVHVTRIPTMRRIIPA